VEGESGGGDEGSVAAAAGTAQVGGLVDPGTQVVPEVALALEAPFAVGAVCVHVAVVFLELCIVVEILSVIRFVCDIRVVER